MLQAGAGVEQLVAGLDRPNEGRILLNQVPVEGPNPSVGFMLPVSTPPNAMHVAPATRSSSSSCAGGAG